MSLSGCEELLFDCDDFLSEKAERVIWFGRISYIHGGAPLGPDTVVTFVDVHVVHVVGMSTDVVSDIGGTSTFVDMLISARPALIRARVPTFDGRKVPCRLAVRELPRPSLCAAAVAENLLGSDPIRPSATRYIPSSFGGGHMSHPFLVCE